MLQNPCSIPKVMTIFANQSLVKPNLQGSTLVIYYDPTKKNHQNRLKGRWFQVNLGEAMVLTTLNY
jgi:hypothetical protein